MMEREIKEDFTIIRKPWWVFAWIVIGVYALVAIVSRDVRGLLLFLGVAAFILVSVHHVLPVAFRELAQSPKRWRLTDGGLLRVYSDKEQELIRWEQIRHLRWVKNDGLILRWEESEAEHRRRCKAFRDEFKWDFVYRQFRGVLTVQEAEAREVIATVGKMKAAAGDSLMDQVF